MQNSPLSTLEEDIRRLERIIPEALSKEPSLASIYNSKTLKPPKEELQSFAKDVVSRWIKGESPKQIAQGTGQTIKLTYQLLNRIQKAITEKNRIR